MMCLFFGQIKWSIVNFPVYFLRHVLQVLSYKIIFSNLPLFLVIYFHSYEGYIFYQKNIDRIFFPYSCVTSFLIFMETHPETSKKAKSKTKALITVGSLYKTNVWLVNIIKSNGSRTKQKWDSNFVFFFLFLF